MNPANTGQSQANADPSQFGEYSNWAQQEMAKGFTPEQLHASLGTTQTQPQAQQGSGGNWFTHLLPTIGGIAGGALGSIADVFSGPLGTIGGSAGGSALGKTLENALEGKQAVQGNDLTAGIEGGVGAGVGGLAGKVIGKAGSALGDAAKSITDNAAQETANNATKDAITDTATSYKDVPIPIQKLYNAKDSLDHVADMGFDPKDPANLVKVGTNSNDVLNSTLDSALANSGPVDMSNYSTIVKNALADEGNTLGSFDKVALARGRLGVSNTPASKVLDQLENLGAGVAKTNSDPNELRNLTTKLYQAAQDAKPTVTAATGAIDPQQRAIYNVINNVRDQVKSALYDRPEVNEALQGAVGNITPEDVGSQQLADHLNDVITKAGQGGNSAAQDFLDEIKKNINVNNLGQEGQKAGQIVSSTGAQDRALLDAGIPTSTEASAAGSGALDIAGHLANPHTSLPAKVIGGAAKVATNPTILSTLSRIGALGDKLAPAAGVAAATASNLGAGPVDATGMAPGAANGTMGGTMQNANLTGAANGTTDPNNMSSILSRMMYMGNVDPYLLSSTAPVVQSLAPQVQKQELAANEIGALPSSYANAGGAQGSSGILSRISGLIPGTAANTYQGQEQAAAQALSTAMGITPQAAASMLPQLMQNPQTAGLTQSILGNVFGQMAG